MRSIGLLFLSVSKKLAFDYRLLNQAQIFDTKPMVLQKRIFIYFTKK